MTILKKVEIEIEGTGYKGKITGLGGEVDFYTHRAMFLVWIDFNEPYPDPRIKSMSVYIPAKHYTRDEFIEALDYAVSKKLAEERERQRELENYWREQQKVEALAQKVVEDISKES